MNTYQRDLYNQLMTLCAESDAFYFKDFMVDEKMFRIFNYRLASYTEFMKPGGLECRGTMFLINNTGPVRLAALPLEKFFNLYENPMTMDLDLSTIVEAETKSDGSLISTYLYEDGDLRLKTKGSTDSDQCKAAMEYIAARPELEQELLSLAESQITVNMEWCSPQNRIVLSYEDDQLIVLSCRDMMDGSYIEQDEYMLHTYSTIRSMWSDRLHCPDEGWEAWVEAVSKIQGIEGYVCRLESGQRFKLKTEWYLVLHHTKDSINSPRRLYEAVLQEATDDMRSLFHDDPIAIQMIDDMEKFVDEKYNSMVALVEDFYETNKALDRKSYAIKGQLEFPNLFFGLVMQKYTGREVDYKDFMVRKWKEFGLKDGVKRDD